jgi:hypothetical protein
MAQDFMYKFMRSLNRSGMSLRHSKDGTRRSGERAFSFTHEGRKLVVAIEVETALTNTLAMQTSIAIGLYKSEARQNGTRFDMEGFASKFPGFDAQAVAPVIGEMLQQMAFSTKDIEKARPFLQPEAAEIQDNDPASQNFRKAA